MAGQGQGYIEKASVIQPKKYICNNIYNNRCYLGGHDSLSLRDQLALGAHALSPVAEALVSLEQRHEAVVPAARALGHSGAHLASGGSRCWRSIHGLLFFAHHSCVLAGRLDFY